MSQQAGALSISATGNTPKQVKEAVEKAGERWLKNPEVIDILQNYEKYEFKVSNEPPVQPPGGSIFLFDRKQVRFFRKDGHNWRKKPDGKTVRETHEKLKVDNQDVLNCYYAHAEEQEDNFQLQRRCYWLLEGESNLVLVHYLNVPAEALRTRSDQHGSTELADDANASGMHQMSINDVPGAMPRYGMMDPNAGWHDSGRANRNMPMMYSNMQPNAGGSSGMQGPQSWGQDNALSRRQDPMEAYNWQQQGHPASGSGMDGVGNMVGNVMPNMNYGSYSPAAPNDWQYQGQGQAPFNFSAHHGQQYPVNMPVDQSGGGMMPGYHNQPHGRNSSDYSGVSHGYSGHQMTGVGIDHSHMHGWQGDVRGASSSMDPTPQQHAQQRASPQSYDYWPVMPQDSMPAMQEMPQGSPAPQQSQPQRGKMGQMDPHNASWFEIVDFSPSWDYTSGGSKILLTGTPDGLADMQLFAMFGNTEVPAVRLQPGVLRFQAPSHAPGSVSLCLTTGEGKVCSGNVEFNYELPVKDPPSNLITSITTATSDRDLQVRLVTRLLKQTGGSVTGEDGESAAEVGKGEHSNLVDAAMARVSNLDAASAERVLLLLLERELKIFSQQVIGQHGLEGPMALNPLNGVDDEGMGLIHIVAALGYDWAVELLLQSNADVQLRDPWGLTPLHWAAAKGHENTIAVLLRYGANGNALSYTLGAVNGFTPADLASMHNHSGIAAYLSETHLAQGLSKLQLSDDRGSFRKRNRNRPINMSQSNDTAAEEEVHLISSAARKAAEKIYLAMESGKSPVLKVDQAIAHGTQQEIGMNIAAAAPDLDLAVNRVEAIVHNPGARMQYMKMREAADRNQVSVVSGACDEVEQTSQ